MRNARAAAIAAARKSPITAAIEKTGRVLFGDDWIGELTQREIDLLVTHGPRLAKGAVGSIAPCPQKYRRALDRAIGRDHRANSQRDTALDWLLQHGLVTVHSLSCDAAALSRALARHGVLTAATSAGKGRGQGRPDDKTREAADEIERTLGRQLSYSKFTEMTDEEVRERFGLSSRAVARSARKQIVFNRSESTN